MIICLNGINFFYNISVLGIFFCSIIIFIIYFLNKRKILKIDIIVYVFINVVDLMVVFNFYRILFSLLINWKLFVLDLFIFFKKMKLEVE